MIENRFVSIKYSNIITEKIAYIIDKKWNVLIFITDINQILTFYNKLGFSLKEQRNNTQFNCISDYTFERDNELNKNFVDIENTKFPPYVETLQKLDEEKAQLNKTFFGAFVKKAKILEEEVLKTSKAFIDDILSLSYCS